MKSNKKSLYILLPLVVVIWSVIIYKIFAAIHTEESNTPSNFSNSISNIILPKESQEIFELDDLKRDPFLDKIYRKKVPKKNIVVRENIEWPDIKYLGLVATGDKNDRVAIFRIDNQEILLKTGEEFQGIKLLNVNNANSLLIYKKQKKSINR